VIELVDELRFGSQVEKHELSHLYEAKVKNMGNAGRNGGEYYTPRPLIRAMIKVVAPRIGERIYDGACGSAGLLCEAFDYLSPLATKADDLKTLQTRTFYGREKKSLADNIADIQERDRYDVILATSFNRVSRSRESPFCEGRTRMPSHTLSSEEGRKNGISTCSIRGLAYGLGNDAFSGCVCHFSGSA
jgi:hypothetical protein